MYKEKVCSVGITLRLFWMAQLNYPSYSDLKTSDLNGLGGNFVLEWTINIHNVKYPTIITNS